VDLSERTLDLNVLLKSNVPADRPLKMSDMAGGEGVTVRGPWSGPYVREQDLEADGAR